MIISHRTNRASIGFNEVKIMYEVIKSSMFLIGLFLILLSLYLLIPESSSLSALESLLTGTMG